MMRAIGLAVASGIVAIIAWGSHAPMPLVRSDEAFIRLAWSTRPERIETCRRLTDAELEGVPAHMRQRVVCTGHSATYRLVVAVDGRLLSDRLLAGGGARRDRAIYVLEDHPSAPGERRVTIRLERVDSIPDTGDREALAEDATPREEREAAERERRRLEAVPPVLVLDTTVVLAPRRGGLVTYDPGARTLVFRTPAPSSPR